MDGFGNPTTGGPNRSSCSDRLTAVADTQPSVRGGNLPTFVTFRARSRDRRNVVLLCLDTVREDFFDEHAPRLRALADTTVHEARAASAWSVPAHASMFTGTYPSETGVHSYQLDFSSLDVAETFLDTLPSHTRLGVSANNYASSAFGFDELFHEYVDVDPGSRFPEGLNARYFVVDDTKSRIPPYKKVQQGSLSRYLRLALRNDHPIRSVVNSALFALRERLADTSVPGLFDDGAELVSREALSLVSDHQEPYFLFLNCMDAHVLLRPLRVYDDDDLHSAPNAWSSRALDFWQSNLDGPSAASKADLAHYRDLYAAAIDYHDRRVAAFVKTLARRSDRETTFPITADHGENLAFEDDRNLIDHKCSLTERLLRVPFLVMNPPRNWEYDGKYLPHRRLPGLITDLAHGRSPSVREDAAFPTAELLGIGTDVGPFRTTRSGEFEYWNRAIRCAYRDRRKVVWNSQGRCIRYDLDPSRPSWQRRRDAVNEVPEWATEQFDEPIETTKRRIERDEDLYESPPDSLDPAVRSRLEDTGYL